MATAPCTDTIFLGFLQACFPSKKGVSQRVKCGGGGAKNTTVIIKIITFLIQKHFKTGPVTGNPGKLIRMTFKVVIGNQWKWRGDCGRQDGNGNGDYINSSEFQDGNGNGNLGEKILKITRLPVMIFRRRTNVQQLTCNIDLSNSFYLLVFFSFVLLEQKPFVLKGKVLGEQIWKNVKKCEKMWNYETMLPFSCCPLVFKRILFKNPFKLDRVSFPLLKI